MKKLIVVLIMIVASLIIKDNFIGNDNKVEHSKMNIEIPADLLEWNPFWADLSMVIYNPDINVIEVYNENQANERMSPCSTYKLPHSLIGLETGVLNNSDNLIEWDGQCHYIKSWNRDHTLKTAIQNSVVWYFQVIANEIGPEKTQLYLNKIDYGNNDISGGQSGYWLKSSLKISAFEQVEFLEQLYNNDLDFSVENQELVKELIKLDTQGNMSLYGKTGGGENLGWFIGFVEKDNCPIYFALNMKNHPKANGQTAKKICLDVLNAKGM